jgi:hypothetical protein
MILTPVADAGLPRILAGFAARLSSAATRCAFARIARPEAARRAEGAVAAAHHRAALALAAELGMAARPGSPAEDFAWDGRSLRADTEAYVLLHEVAHYQLAAPGRRGIVDFALGAGPETGDRLAADRAQRLFGIAREREEAMASLLGILWEVELGHPALASFLDQNWLEGAGRPGAARHFQDVLARLAAEGFIAPDGRPTRRLRQAPDEAA